MTYRYSLVSVGIMVASSLLLFRFYEKEFSQLWLNLAVHPEIQEALDQGALDLRIPFRKAEAA